MDEAIKTHLALAREHFSRDDWSAAEPHVRAVLAARDDLPDAHYMLGVVLHDQGEFAEARAQFEAALKLNPDYTEAALNLAITCNELGRYREARKVVRAITTRSRVGERVDPYARGKLANLHAGVARAYEALNLWTEAADEYLKALNLCPEFSDLRTRLALALRADGDPAAAVQQLEVAVTIAPKYVPARVALGLSYFGLRRNDDAEAAWKGALELDPDCRPAQVYLRMLTEGLATPSQFPPPDAVPAADDEVRFTLLDDEDEPDDGSAP